MEAVMESADFGPTGDEAERFFTVTLRVPCGTAISPGRYTIEYQGSQIPDWAQAKDEKQYVNRERSDKTVFNFRVLRSA